jgi:Holliday junction resolvasome RuvABC endonuclease subunit
VEGSLNPEAYQKISRYHMGQWDLSAGPYDSGAIRFLRLRHFLHATRPDAVFYEDVKFDPPGVSKMNAGAVLARVATASEFLGALKATVCTWCEEHAVPCTGFKIGTIKKRATGRGNANKEDMIRACNELFGSSLEVEGYESSGTDNIADSAFVCLLGLEQYADALSDPA